VKAEEYLKNILGNNFEKVKQFFSDLSKPNRLNAIPRGRVINTFLIITAEGELVIRHEGGEDITLASIDGSKYPIILHEKLVSAWRRQMLEILRHDYDRNKGDINNLRGNNNDWDCSLRPTASVKKGKGEERMGGLCGECPNCMTFGFAVKEGGEFNLKSRVEGDLYISTTPEQMSVVVRTFNAIDDVTHTTLISGEGQTTGALFRLSLVKEGTVFVGKVAIKDVSMAELLLLLFSLAKVSRIGGIKSDFGKIKVRIPALIFAPYEVSSGYDIFKRVKGLVNAEEVMSKINEYLKSLNEGILITGGFESEVNAIYKNNVIDHDVIKEAWENGINFRKSIEQYISKKE